MADREIADLSRNECFAHLSITGVAQQKVMKVTTY